ncbi:MAG: hypothetical protein SNJ54_08620 [Anaerolineae bacterium]
MSYTVEWHDEDKTVIVARSGEQLTYPELDRMFYDALALAQDTNQPFYAVVDLCNLKRVEAMNIREMQRLGQHPFTHHPNRQKTIITFLSPRVRIIVDAFVRLFPRYARGLATADDLPHALRLIAADKQKATTAG